MMMGQELQDAGLGMAVGMMVAVPKSLMALG